MSNSLGCGSCNLCCHLLAIPDLAKPARMWCEHALRPHGGCAVHGLKASEPSLAACVSFECLWLQSQRRVDPTERLGIELRPNRCGVVMGPQDQDDPELLYVQVDPDKPQAWKAPLVAEYLDGILARGGRIEVIIGERRVLLGPPAAGMPLEGTSSYAA